MSWDKVLSTGADLAGSMYQNYRDKKMLGVANAFSASEAQKNRDWQERMSNTAYQRSAKDLQAAGLNRILALGGPASSGGGSSASSVSPQPTRKPDILQARLVQQQINTAKQTERLTAEQTRLTAAKADKEQVTKKPYETIMPAVDTVSKGASSAIDSIMKGTGGRDWVRGVKKIYNEIKKLNPVQLRELKRLNDNQKKSGVDVLLPGVDY